VKENNPDTCVLRIRLTDVSYIGGEAEGYKGYKINFVHMTAED